MFQLIGYLHRCNNLMHGHTNVMGFLYSMYNNLCLIITFLCSTGIKIIPHILGMQQTGTVLDISTLPTECVSCGKILKKKASGFHLENVKFINHKSFCTITRYCGNNETHWKFHWSMKTRKINISQKLFNTLFVLW